MTVNGGNANSHQLTSLINGNTYTLSIATTSVNLLSEDVDAGDVSLGKCRIFHVRNNIIIVSPQHSSRSSRS